MTYKNRSGKARGRHTKRNHWLSILTEILKKDTRPLTFPEIVDKAHENDPKKAMTINVGSTTWGWYVKTVDEITMTFKRHSREMIIDGKVFSRPMKQRAYQWLPCEHLDYTDTLTGAVCNDCGVEKEMVI